jgi:acetyl esterase/lipase
VQSVRTIKPPRPRGLPGHRPGHSARCDGREAGARACRRARAAVAFVEYTLSPEARYPVAIKQGCSAAQWIASTAHLEP